MDHSGIRIRIGFEGIVPRIPIYDKIVFRRCRKLSDAEIDNLLNNEFKGLEYYISIFDFLVSSWNPFSPDSNYVNKNSLSHSNQKLFN